MTAHKHAALMMQYAQDALETDKPWERWEFTASGNEFESLSNHPYWYEDYEYRRKPRTPIPRREPAVPPKAPPPPYYAPCKRAADPAERVALIQQELAEAEAALAAKNERDALAAKIDAEIALAEATSTLLADIRILRLTGNQTFRRMEFAVYRKELAALAAKYDVKIVLVGDKSAAVLVLN